MSATPNPLTSLLASASAASSGVPNALVNAPATSASNALSDQMTNLQLPATQSLFQPSSVWDTVTGVYDPTKSQDPAVVGITTDPAIQANAEAVEADSYYYGPGGLPITPNASAATSGLTDTLSALGSDLLGTGWISSLSLFGLPSGASLALIVGVGWWLLSKSRSRSHSHSGGRRTRHHQESSE